MTYQPPSVTIYVGYPGTLLEPSLYDVTIRSSSVLNPGYPALGTLYDGWCLVRGVDIPINSSYTAYLFSSYEPAILAAGGVPSLSASLHLDKLDSVNWVLNEYNGLNYAYGDVQRVIWKLMGWADVPADYLGTQNQATIDDLYARALAQDGFQPDVGQSIGIVLDPVSNGTHWQPLIIETKAAKLGDFVWHDLDADGIQDAGEPGIAGVTVNLVRDLTGDGDFNDANEVLATTQTDANGLYSFKALTPGLNYQVQFLTPIGYSAGSPRQVDGNPASGINSDGPVSNVVVLAPGEYNSTIDSGFYKSASLGDRLWVDTNANGQQDDGATGISGQIVTLIGGGADRLIATTGDNTSSTTTTGTDGFYSFTGLTPGVEYQVEFSKPAGSVYTVQDAGSDASDSDADPSSGKSQIVVLASGEHNPTIDAGVFTPAALGDFVWEDRNADGKQDGGEPGIGGVTVLLYDCVTNALVASTSTAADGSYSFTGLKPGTYHVVFTTPAGYVQTTANVGGNGFDAIDSDAGVAGQTVCYTLASGDNNTTVDAGYYRTASLGDRLWVDTNANGQQDDGATGISGQIVKLISGGADGLIATTGDNTSSTTITGTDGFYSFTGLTPGVEYQVEFSKPTGSVYTVQNVGADASDSDADPGTGRSQIVVLASGENNPTIDAGVYTAGIDIEKLVRGEYMIGIGGTEGLTPGFWKTHSQFGPAPLAGWPESGYAPLQSWEGIFGRDVPGTPTLLEALQTGGGGLNALLRHATAALLNAANPNVDYQYTVAQVISMTQAAIDSGSVESTKDLFAAQNEKGADLSTPAGSTLVVTPDVDADTPGSGPLIPIGGKAVFTYIVKNLGDVAIEDVRVTDNRLTNLTFLGGDVDGDNRLDPTETWRYTASETVTASGEVINVGTAEGRGGSGAVTDSDAAHYGGAPIAQSLGDFVWLDANANGRQDSGETGIAGLAVTLIGGGADGVINGIGDTTAATTTDADGRYLFTGLQANVQYQVQFTKPEGSTFVQRDAVAGNDSADSDADVATGRSQIVTLSPGQNNLTIDAGVYASASLGNRIWWDNNRNCQQDAGEAGISGLTVKLIGGGADRLINGIGDTVATTTTGTDGHYLFSGLTAGVQYQVQFSKPTGTAYTARDAGADASDSDADTATGKSQVVTLAAGESNLTVDAGVIKSVIGNRVWYDTDKDGIQDVGESGVAGVNVTLKTDRGATVATTTTDASGNYSFSVVAGKYQLVMDRTGVSTPTTKWTTKDANRGKSDTVDSDVDSTGKTAVFTVAAGEVKDQMDAGITPIVIDLDGNGIRTVSRADSAGTFDLLGNGSPIRSGWLSGGDGFLAADKNGNGRIDSIAELFGGNVKGAGFAKLATYDSNSDGVVDQMDTGFSDLRIWRDADGNQRTDAGELMTLAQAGVAALKVTHVDLPFLDAQGNLHLERSSAAMRDGREVDMTDVYFNVERGAGAAPTMAELLGDDRALDDLLGREGHAAPPRFRLAKDAHAETEGMGSSESAEALRQLTAMVREADMYSTGA